MSADFERSLSILDSRLVSIESKLDRIIRVEERQNTHADDLKRAYVRIEKIEVRVRDLELNDRTANEKTKNNSGAIAMIVSAVISVVVGVITWKVKGP